MSARWGAVMTTYRERRERRAERLRGWAEKREEDAAAVFEAGRPFTSDYAFNTQPGHIPLRAKIIAREDRAFESLRKAESMSARADGIEAQLVSSIYSDDPDAAEALAAKLARLEAERDRVKRYNALRRKRKPADPLEAFTEDAAAAGMTPAEMANIRDGYRAVPYQFRPYGAMPAYHLQNLGGTITRTRQRLEQVKRTAEMVEAGERGRGKPMLSRYAGTCPDCGEAIEKGSAIVYYHVTREALHAGCVKGGNDA